MADMDCHGTFVAQSSFLPDGFIQQLGGIYFSGIFHQQVKNGVFCGGQRHRIAVYGDGFCAVVQNDAADGNSALRRGRTAAQFRVAAQMGTDTGQNFHRDKYTPLFWLLILRL